LIIDTVFEDVIKKITERFHFDTTRIFLFDSDFETLTLKAYYNTVHAPAVGIGPFRKGQSVVGRVAQSGEAAFFEDIQTDPRYQAWSESSASKGAGFQFFAVLPIKTKTRIFGAAAFCAREPRQLNDDETRLLNAMCEHVAVAVEKTSLFEQLKKRNEDLQRTNQELEEAVRVKSEFVSGMSHELRTPLNVIMGYAKMTSEGFFGDLNGEQKDALEKVSRHADVLLKMVNNVLNLSKVEAKKSSLDIGKVDPHELIAQVKAQVQPLNRHRRLEFAWDIDIDVPQLTTDPLKLEEILQNLIANAIKFTPAGKIEIHVRNLAQQNRVEFSVADTGIGIEESELGTIFTAFEQGKEAHTGNIDGVGLGLSIVKRYLELMQGEIRVTSRVGQGTTFTFSIPRTLENGAQAAA
jgi:signal transduction histidine kinase